MVADVVDLCGDWCDNRVCTCGDMRSEQGESLLEIGVEICKL